MEQNDQGKAKGGLPKPTVIESILYLCVASIANDEELECKCGQGHFLDGNTCPRCTCIIAKDYVDELRKQ